MSATAGIAPVVAFGHTWLREIEVRQALGFQFDHHFRRTVMDAELYRGSVKFVMVDEREGRSERCFTLDGAQQLALYCLRMRSDQGKRLAREFLDRVQSIRSPSFGVAA